MGTPLKVMQYGGKSYVQLRTYASASDQAYLKRDYRINGAEPVLGNGDCGWAFVEGDVSSIETRHLGPQTLIRFDRRPNAPEKLPETLSKEVFIRDDECCGGWRCTEGYGAEFYDAIYEPGVDWWEPLEFEVIDRNCRPVKMEKWAKVNWPANVERYAEQQHKYPCYIDVKDLFSLVAEAAKAKVGESDGALQFDDYLNIGFFRIKRIILIPVEIQKSERREVFNFGRSRRRKFETVTRKAEARTLFTYNGFYSNPSDPPIYQTPSLQAKNYEDLKAAVEAHVAEIVGKCDTDQWCICPECKGKGLIIAESTATA